MNGEAQMFWGLLFGSIGLAFAIYGRKQRAPVPLLCGVGLMVYPWFVTNTAALIAVGVILAVLPYFFRQ